MRTLRQLQDAHPSIPNAIPNETRTGQQSPVSRIKRPDCETSKQPLGQANNWEAPNYTGLRSLEIEDVILFSSDGVATLLNRPNAIITAQGGSRVHIRKCEATIPDRAAPTRNPSHTLASIRARAR